MVPIIMDTSFKRLGEIDDYSSFIWTTRFTRCGDFELALPVTEKNMELIQVDRYVVRDVDENIGIIENIDFTLTEDMEESMIVSGRFLLGFLARRIISEQTVIDSSLVEAIEKLLNENAIAPTMAARQLPGLSFVNQSSSKKKIEMQFTGNPLLDAIEGLCDTYSLGIKCLMTEPGQFKIVLYDGVDRSLNQTDRLPVIFSDEYDNVASSKYFIEKSKMITEVLVAGEGQGDDRKKVWSSVWMEKPERIFDQTQVLNDQLTNFSVVWDDESESWKFHGTKAASVRGLRIQSDQVFEVGKTYKLVYNIQKTAGTMSNIAHTLTAAGFEQVSYYVNGKAIASPNTNATGTNVTTPQRVEYTFKYLGGQTNNTILIQPNKGATTSVTFDVWDLGCWEVQEMTGYDRYEKWDDSRNLNTNNQNIPIGNYLNQLAENGMESLNTNPQLFGGVVYFDHYKYREDINVGDICEIVSTRWGLRTSQRIIEVIESVNEAGAYSIIPTFG